MRQLKWSQKAQEDLAYWQENHLKTYQKIITLCQNACINPKKGIGKPEPLKHQWSGYWSRRINKEHRLIYRFDDETVYIVQARYHY